MVTEGDDDAAGGQLEDVGIVDVICVGRTAGDLALEGPGSGSYQREAIHFEEGYEPCLAVVCT